MGDVLTLVEKAESAIKADDAEEMTKRMMQAKFDFNDFLKQMKMMSNMGSMGAVMKMMPGLIFCGVLLQPLRLPSGSAQLPAHCPCCDSQGCPPGQCSTQVAQCAA